MYAELHCKTNYSFLTGGSHADELVDRAVAHGYSALAVTDENSLAGIVRAYAATRKQPIHRPFGVDFSSSGVPGHFVRPNPQTSLDNKRSCGSRRELEERRGGRGKVQI